MSKRIPLTKGKFAIVDDEDYEWLNQWKWSCVGPSRGRSNGYACRAVWLNGKTKVILMHRLVINAPNGLQVDHIDHDSLNNQKTNLRLATQTQQNANRQASKNNKTGYKGVRFVEEKGKYRARIGHKGKTIHLGYFTNPEDAAVAYNAAAKQLFGEYAFLNDLS